MFKSAQKVSKKRPKSVQKVPKKYPNSILKISKQCPKSTQKVSKKCSKNVQKVPYNNLPLFTIMPMNKTQRGKFGAKLHNPSKSGQNSNFNPGSLGKIRPHTPLIKSQGSADIRQGSLRKFCG